MWRRVIGWPRLNPRGGGGGGQEAGAVAAVIVDSREGPLFLMSTEPGRSVTAA